MNKTAIAAFLAAQVLGSVAWAAGIPGFYGRRDFEYASNPADDGTIILTVGNGLSGRWIPGQATISLPFTAGTVNIAANGSRVSGINNNLSFNYNLPSGPFQELPRPPGSNVLASYARAISADGNTIVGTDTSVGAWKWTPLGGTQLLSSNTATQANGISRDGSKIVGRIGSRPMLYTAGTGAQAIPSPAGAANAEFRGVSGDGLVAIGDAEFSSINRPALRWTQSSGYELLPTLQNLPGVSDQFFIALSATLDGSVIVGTQSGRRAWIWDAGHGTRDLRDVLVNSYGYDLTNWTLESANSISSDGSIITGTGAYFNGSAMEFRAWAVVIPGPGTSAPLLFAACLLTCRTRSRPARTLRPSGDRESQARLPGSCMQRATSRSIPSN